MTELKSFLLAVYDSLSEAEVQAFRHGQQRLAALAEQDAVPEDIAVPVYHARDMEVTLDTGLDVDRTDSGQRVYLTDPSAEDASRVTFTVDVFDFVEKSDLGDNLPDGVIDELPPGKQPPSDLDEEHANAARNRPLRTIDAIDATIADILEHHGIETAVNLLQHSPEEIAEIVREGGESISFDRSAELRETVREVVDPDRDDRDQPIEAINGIGPTFGEQLREAGMTTVGDLLERSPAEVAEAATTAGRTVSFREAHHWILHAQRRCGGQTWETQGENQ